ncbi:hypothetical protein ETD86_48760 [Nonomuraea turkmeniaca]|uniref:Uncharacterized protein n=1 Tax=Nonomuraea turkmeniaca TaxID=103838 RepID=A0A5S4EX59_9ACTN|nr:hypothetical protein [Nonomuraea turkmeniaca]TMR08208.1 hypothetical protein ETD86_48760 [Nonomuraea turkmeniaca]
MLVASGRRLEVAVTAQQAEAVGREQQGQELRAFVRWAGELVQVGLKMSKASTPPGHRCRAAEAKKPR